MSVAPVPSCPRLLSPHANSWLSSKWFLRYCWRWKWQTKCRILCWLWYLRTLCWWSSDVPAPKPLTAHIDYCRCHKALPFHSWKPSAPHLIQSIPHPYWLSCIIWLLLHAIIPAVQTGNFPPSNQILAHHAFFFLGSRFLLGVSGVEAALGGVDGGESIGAALSLTQWLH